jgi:hypothetical protein
MLGSRDRLADACELRRGQPLLEQIEDHSLLEADVIGQALPELVRGGQA